MKKFVALLVMLTVGGSLLAQTPAQAPTQTSTSTQTSTPAPTPAKPGPKAKDVKKTEPEPKIDGWVITRKDGTFLGLTIVDTKFTLKFYDKKKKLTKADVDRARIRWNNPQATGTSATILNPKDASTLVGANPVTGNVKSNLYVTLLKNAGDADTDAETYVVNPR